MEFLEKALHTLKRLVYKSRLWLLTLLTNYILIENHKKTLINFCDIQYYSIILYLLVGAAVVVLFGGRGAGVDEWLGGIFVGEGMLSVWLLTIILPLTSVTAGVLTVVPANLWNRTKKK